jgi:hypothetical protein
MILRKQRIANIRKSPYMLFSNAGDIKFLLDVVDEACALLQPAARVGGGLDNTNQWADKVIAFLESTATSVDYPDTPKRGKKKVSE